MPENTTPTITYEQYQRVCMLGSQSGFFNAYFELLPKANTNVEAFNQINDEYYEYFGFYKYSEYSSFRRAIRNYYKSNRNN